MSSSVPASLPQFIAIAQAALPANFQVRQAQIFGPYVAPQALLITGIHFLKDSYAELGPSYRHEEDYNILCSLFSTAGNDDEPSRLTEVGQLYADLSVAVANNPTLNNTVRVAWTRQLDYTFAPTGPAFSAAQVNFEVDCQVRVTSLS